MNLILSAQQADSHHKLDSHQFFKNQVIRLLSKTKGPSCINNTAPMVWHKRNPNQWSSHSLLLRKMTVVTEGQDNQEEDLYCDGGAFH